MKKMLVVLVMMIGCGAFAWCRPCPPPPPCWGRPGSDGLANAAMIVDIVANGVAIANNLFGGPVAVPAPVAVAPAAVAAPVAPVGGGAVAVAPHAIVPPGNATPMVPAVHAPYTTSGAYYASQCIRMNGVPIPVVRGY